MHLICRQVGRCVEAIFEPVCPHFSWTGKTSVSKALRENQLGTAVITKGPCLSLFSSSPFQAEFPELVSRGEGMVQTLRQFRFNALTPTRAQPGGDGGGKPGSFSPLPHSESPKRRCSGLVSEAFFFFFLVETFKSNRCSAHGNRIPRFSGTFLKVGACCGVWLNFWE